MVCRLMHHRVIVVLRLLFVLYFMCCLSFMCCVCVVYVLCLGYVLCFVYISCVVRAFLEKIGAGTKCCPGTTCLLSASFLRHLSLAVAGLSAPLSRFLEGALYKYPE